MIFISWLRINSRNLIYSGFRKILYAIAKRTNSLLAQFPDDQIAGKSVGIHFDWSDYSISTPYVIFITGRCGSTLLSNLIKDTQLAGAPEEYFNVDNISRLNISYQAKSFLSYLRSIVESSKCRGRFGSEIDWWQLRQLDRVFSFQGIFPPAKTKFFYMTRRDIVAQAYSFAAAKSTGIWHHYSGTPTIEVGKPSPSLTDQRIWGEILLLLESEMQMERFFTQKAIKPIRLDYEMLMTSRMNVLALVLLNLGCDVDSIIRQADSIVDRTLKNPRDNFAQILAFRAKYSDLLTAVENARGCSYAAIRWQLGILGLTN
jgi:LPS sulfotransferase NodH